MAIGPRLDLRQSQQLVMTPQLQQAIKLLTLTNMELSGFIDTEVEKNPLLELGNDDSDGPDPDRDGAGVDDQPEGGEADSGDGLSITAADEGLRADTIGGGDDAALDVAIEDNVFQHDCPSDRPMDAADQGGGLDGLLTLNGGGAVGAGGAEDEANGLERLMADEPSLHDHLLAQAGEAFADPVDRFIATHLIDLVDDAGYMREHLGEIALRLGVPQVRVEQVLRQLQTFDPTGVGARDLAECLKLQAAEADRLDPAMSIFIDHLDLLARGELAHLRRICRVDEEDLADMIRELRSYNPKPGLKFGGERPHAVIPDIFVRRSAGGWAVELNGATLPRLLINRNYFTQLSQRTTRREDKGFLSDCLQSANWLTKALDQRARTILKVAAELVRQQEEFFERGVHYLRPLNLRAIAEVIEMHESTVSRVTAGKYLSCPRGVFELKYFFTSAIQSSDGGDAHSAQAVKQRIRELIDREDGNAILSDDKLVEILQAEKFDIARRTVAKYREALKIPSSVQRRRAKLLIGERQAMSG